jgi:cell division protease FtsH
MPIWKHVLIFALGFIFVATLFNAFTSQNQKTQYISLNELAQSINKKIVKSLKVENNKITAELSDNKKQIAYKEAVQPLTDVLNAYGVASDTLRATPITIDDQSKSSFWKTVLLTVALPFILIAVFIWFMMRQVQGANNKAMSFGQTNVKQAGADKKNKTTFIDVAGAHEAKEELQEIVEFLKFPKKFLSLGAKIPKGVLLFGAPGTGKTLLARAVAGEANVPFFHISGSEFVEMFVGVGASRVRDLFAKAKKQSPCIVFIDEIDAVGRQRGAGLGGSHDEREQTLNQILVEIDGFEKNDKVIVMAATNRPDVLDPALLRPGRFDRQIIIDLPDIKDREAILKVHAKDKPITNLDDLLIVAQRTPGFSGADLANILNEAAILAARKNKNEINKDELYESIEKVLLGPVRKSFVLNDKEKKITAYHEAGHAIVGHLLPDADPIHKISIISRGRAAGYTLKLPIEDKKFQTKNQFVSEIKTLLAGMITEELIFQEMTTGAANDLKQVTKIARQLITQYGMNESLGPRVYGQQDELIFLGREIHEQRDYSEQTAEKIDNEIDKLLNSARQETKNMLIEQRKQLDIIANALLEKETIEKDEFEQLMNS